MERISPFRSTNLPILSRFFIPQKTLKLLPAKQTMAQQLACVSVQPSTGYTAWRPDEIVFSKNEVCHRLGSPRSSV